MILFDPQWVIDRLDIQVGALRKVAGSADFAVALDDLKPAALPAAYVLPGAESAGRSTTGTQLVSQQNRPRFGVMLAVSNLRDARGENAQTDLRTLRIAVMTVLLGWSPDAAFDPVEFAGGKLFRMSNGVLWWMDEFSTAHLLRSA